MKTNNNLVCTAHGKPVYFSFDSYMPELKQQFINYALKHITNDSFLFSKTDGLKALIAHCPTEFAQAIEEYILNESLNLSAVSTLYRVLEHEISSELLEKIKSAAIKRWISSPVQTIDIGDLLANRDKSIIEDSENFPYFILDVAYKPSIGSNINTQSQSHFNTNIQHILNSLSHYSNYLYGTPMRQTLLDAVNTEITETKKGNYIFWHARSWYWEFRADLYKQLHNLVSQDDLMSDDYVPLRLGDHHNNFLGMSYALFSDYCPRPLGSLFGNYSDIFAMKMYTPEYLFKHFKIEKYYLKYKSRLKKLERLHNQANIYQFGSLLMLSIEPKDIDNVYASHHCTDNQKMINVGAEHTASSEKIIQALRTNPSSLNDNDTDGISFTMQLTSDYASDHKNGPRMFTFNVASTQKMKKYNQLLDSIFMSLKKTISHNRSKNKQLQHRKYR